ncbi:MAG TPA: DNA-directed RNA polymerase [Phycisphaerales bacterium]|nr:DNA-directed RNA polymerase [Phycisphaerales bacterium]
MNASLTVPPDIVAFQPLALSIAGGNSIRSSIDDGLREYRRLAGTGADPEQCLLPGEALWLGRWFHTTTKAIGALRDRIMAGARPAGHTVFRPVLEIVEPDALAAIVINRIVVMHLSGLEEVPSAWLVRDVGEIALAEVAWRQLGDRERPPSPACNGGRGPIGTIHTMCELDSVMRAYSPRQRNWWTNRSLESHRDQVAACFHIGAEIVRLAVDASRLTEGAARTAITVQNRRQKGLRLRGVVNVDSEVLDRLAEIPEGPTLFHTRYGLLLTSEAVDPPTLDAPSASPVRVNVVANMNGEQREAIWRADRRVLLSCLRAVASTKWGIDAQSMQLIEDAYRGRVALISGAAKRLVAHEYDLPVPEAVVQMPLTVKALEVYRERSLAKDENRRRRCARHALQSQLAEARRCVDRVPVQPEAFCDYRYRTYFSSSALHHQGNDPARAMLRLERSKRPGSTGERWLRIHAANLYGNGIDKLALERRIEWVDQHASDIERAASSPARSEFWQGAEKPLQFLAACRAVCDPDGVGSTLPVYMDGSCNALQHLAALGRDAMGASLANMTAASQPRDVYTEITAGVIEEVEHCAEGAAVAAMRAQLSRALIKPVVIEMINGGAAAASCARLLQRLQARGISVHGSAADHAAKVLFRLVVRQMSSKCSGAVALLHHLRKCAGIISRAGHAVRWTTPLGVPVVQPYRKPRICTVRTSLQKFSVELEDRSQPIDVSGQRNGIVANFVQSLDAAHMLLTGRACRADDIDFSARHDAFGCHAADCDALAFHTRDQFVRLHRVPLLKELSHEWQSRYRLELPAPPARGVFDIEDVYRAPHFFS